MAAEAHVTTVEKNREKFIYIFNYFVTGGREISLLEGVGQEVDIG